MDAEHDLHLMKNPLFHGWSWPLDWARLGRNNEWWKPRKIIFVWINTRYLRRNRGFSFLILIIPLESWLVEWIATLLEFEPCWTPNSFLASSWKKGPMLKHDPYTWIQTDESSKKRRVLLKINHLQFREYPSRKSRCPSCSNTQLRQCFLCHFTFVTEGHVPYHSG